MPSRKPTILSKTQPSATAPATPPSTTASPSATVPASGAAATAAPAKAPHKLKIYHYPACSTCKAALKFLTSHDVPYSAHHIVDEPPTEAELRQVLAALKAHGGTLKNLFNTSGAVYKELHLSERLPNLTEAEALDLLSKNGKLIKRPFVVSTHFKTAGFKPEQWLQALG